MESFEVEDSYPKRIGVYVGKDPSLPINSMIMFLEEKMEKISRCGWISICTFFFITVIVSVILIALSYSYVEYNEYAFRKNTASNEVDTSEVYENGWLMPNFNELIIILGRYFWGINYDPIKFNKTFGTLELQDMLVFTVTGIEVGIDVSFQYGLEKESIDYVFKTYGRTVSLN